MRAIQITELSGPDSGVALAEIPEPPPGSPVTAAWEGLQPGEGVTAGEAVLIEVHAAAVSFPDLLQTKGLYQLRPELPFVPGAEVAGVVVHAPDDSSVSVGDRVAAFTMFGGYAEVALAPAALTFKLPDAWDFRQGAAFVLNYHTAYFALQTRGSLLPGETVLVHGAAGGIGTAALQVARGLGARTVAVVSSEAKEAVAREAGAQHVLRADTAWKDEARALGGIDLVLDPVGGDRFTDSLRSLRVGGRVIVVGFTAGSIPEVRVNRLLLGNTDVRGAGWGGYVGIRPQYAREVGAVLAELTAAGYLSPVVGASFPLERAADALTLIDERAATGKVVLEVR
jgi:NADPH2:quinone reductase